MKKRCAAFLAKIELNPEAYYEFFMHWWSQEDMTMKRER